MLIERGHPDINEYDWSLYLDLINLVETQQAEQEKANG